MNRPWWNGPDRIEGILDERVFDAVGIEARCNIETTLPRYDNGRFGKAPHIDLP
jgi:hypothetical protein